MPVRSVLYLQPKRGNRKDLIAAFERLDVFGHALQQAGCLSVEMLAPEEESDPLVVIALWTSRAGIEGWVSNREQAYATTELDQYLDGDPRREIYDVVLSAPSIVSLA